MRFHFGQQRLLSVAVVAVVFNASLAQRPQLIDGGPHPLRQARATPRNSATGFSSDSVFSVIGRWAWGPCQAVDARSSYVYIGNGPTFHILDISNPSAPTIVGEYLTNGYIFDIRLRDSLAFVCTDLGLMLLNISNPQAPTRVGDVAISGLPTRVAPVDSFAYVITEGGSFFVVDITNPAIPRLRGSTGAGGERPYCLAARGRIAYVGTPEFPDLAIINATDPDRLTRFFFDTGGLGISAAVKDTLLFLGMTGFLKIYSIAAPTSPQLMGSVGANVGPLNALTVNGSMAYVAGMDSGVRAIDISNLRAPRLRGLFRRTIPWSLDGTGIATTGNHVMSTFFNGVLLLDAAEPDSLNYLSFFPTGGFTENVVLRDNLAFVACGYSGLWIVDVSNPQKPRSVSNVITGGYTADVVVSDSCAYIVNSPQMRQRSDTSRGLWILDISNVLQPRVLSHHIGIVRFPPGPLHLNTLARQGVLLLVTQVGGIGYDSTLELIDVSNPAQPQPLSVFRSNSFVYYVAVEDSFAFVASADSGLMIVDVRSPRLPIQISKVLNGAIGVSVRHPYMYALRDSLFVFDKSNPRAPLQIGSARIQSRGAISYRTAIEGNYLYWAEGDLGVVDVSSPQHPIHRGRFEGEYVGTGVAAKGDKAFYTQWYYGMWILQNNLATAVGSPAASTLPKIFQLMQNYPNPFNPTTTIEFVISKRVHVTMDIFTLLGQKLSTLFNETVEAGTHMLKFDGSRLSSGIYFYRLITPDNSITRKMAIIR